MSVTTSAPPPPPVRKICDCTPSIACCIKLYDVGGKAHAKLPKIVLCMFGSKILRLQCLISMHGCTDNREMFNFSCIALSLHLLDCTYCMHDCSIFK